MTDDMKALERQCLNFIQTEMNTDEAHDVAHVVRVVKCAKKLCQQEKAQEEIVIPSAFLHDCVAFAKNDPKRCLSSTYAANRAIEFLSSIDYPPKYYEAIHHAISAHSYSAGITPRTLEAKIVQDADRLDALGAIGIGRCIQVSQSFGAKLYNPDDPFCINRSPQDKYFAVDHFYTKLFSIVETMNTRAASEEAEVRKAFMLHFLEQLKQEIN